MSHRTPLSVEPYTTKKHFDIALRHTCSIGRSTEECYFKSEEHHYSGPEETDISARTVVASVRPTEQGTMEMCSTFIR